MFNELWKMTAKPNLLLSIITTSGSIPVLVSLSNLVHNMYNVYIRPGYKKSFLRHRLRIEILPFGQWVIVSEFYTYAKNQRGYL